MSTAWMVKSLGVRLTVQRFTAWLEMVRDSVDIFHRRGEYTVEERKKSLTRADAAIDDCVNAVETDLADIVGQAVGDNPRNWFATTLTTAKELRLQLRALHDVLSKRPDAWLTEKQQKELERLGGELRDRANLLGCAALTLPAEQGEKPRPKIVTPKPNKMRTVMAETYARRLKESDPKFVFGNHLEWGKAIAAEASRDTSLAWTCSGSTAQNTDLWDEEMERQGRSRKGRSVKASGLSAKRGATIGESDDVLRDLAAEQEQPAVDAILESGMGDKEKAETIRKVRDGSLSVPNAIGIAQKYPKRKSPVANRR